MIWTIEYTETAEAQLRKLDRHMARRIVDYLDKRVAGLNDPRRLGRALTGPLGGFWRFRVGECRVVCEIQDRALCVHGGLAPMVQLPRVHQACVAALTDRRRRA